MSTGNIHARAANRASSEDAPNAYALVEATLAVAYEQRTANMIALLVAGYASVQVGGVDYDELANQIVARLHVTETKGAES